MNKKKNVGKDSNRIEWKFSRGYEKVFFNQNLQNLKPRSPRKLIINRVRVT